MVGKKDPAADAAVRANIRRSGRSAATGSESSAAEQAAADKMGLGIKAAEHVAEVSERNNLEHIFLMYHPQRSGIATLLASDSKHIKNLLEGTRKGEALMRKLLPPLITLVD